MTDHSADEVCYLRALQDYDAEPPNEGYMQEELSMSRGETLELVEQEAPAGWLYVRNELDEVC